MRYFPIFVDLDACQVVIVGGGEAALAKVRLVLKTPARVRLVAPDVCGELRELAHDGRIVWRQARFRPADIDGARLVYAATGLADIDTAVSEAARARGILVNAVDTPEQCDFLTPAIVDRDPVVVAIGTEGAAPVLAREIKAHLDGWLPERIGALALFARSLRERAARLIPNGRQRRRFWTDFFTGGPRDAFLSGHETQAKRLADDLLAGAPSHAGGGFVWLVGAGPGDPELMTLKAQRLLQQADVIVTDRLVNPAILEYARRDARRIDAGKQPGRPGIGQDQINDILVSEARAGNIVVRLKGGDPFVFGRGGEELAALQAAGIPAEIVPGITAAVAAAAAARLPLTARGVNRAFTLLTGAAADGHAEQDWAALARPGQAFAVYMGVGAAAHIEASLLAAGMNPATPVVLVENATLKEERIVETRAGALAAAVAAYGVRGPAMIHAGLHWDDLGLKRPGHVEVFPGDGSVVALPWAAPAPRLRRRRAAGGSR